MPALRTLLLHAALVAACSAARPAQAIWAPVPEESLVDEADLIVLGEVTKVIGAGFAVNGRKQDVAIVQVNGVLKALPHTLGAKGAKPKQVRIAQPAQAALAVSTDIRFLENQTGIWLLTKDPQRDVYWASHPSQFQGGDKKDHLVELIKAREEVDSGEELQGLAARAELVATELPNTPAFYEVRFSLKNVSEQPIVLCNYVGNRPLVVDWTGPDGKAGESPHYEWLKRADIAGLAKEDFITLLPGQVRFIGPQSREYGIFFQAAADQPRPEMAVAAPGEHFVTVSYANAETGEQFQLKDVWIGEIAGYEVTFTVK